jgi:CRISPR-associated RAMP protein (TIGR02581 family)
MHKTRYNALRLTLEIRPRGPLLIKAGGLSADPTLPDMQFVRTYHPEKGETVYIPGSSLKGVVRGFTEKVLRTLNRTNSWRWACPTFPDERESCAKRLEEEKNSAAVYRQSCGACRIFGHTRLKGRAAFTDFLPATEIKTEIRYGVAISRLSHAVAQGPFEMEIAVDGTFKGYLLLENYELWQLGLLALALESMNQGLVKVGFGKNRGFGEVTATVTEAQVEEAGLQNEPNALRGLADFVTDEERRRYGLYGLTRVNGLPAPSQILDLRLYQRRVYGAAEWQSIAQKAMEALRTD